MKVLFTEHAELKFRILEEHGFKITKRQIEDAIRSPENVTKGRKGRLIAQRAISESHLIRVVYQEDEGIIRVITFYPVRRRRYED